MIWVNLAAIIVGILAFAINARNARRHNSLIDAAIAGGAAVAALLSGVMLVTGLFH